MQSWRSLPRYLCLAYTLLLLLVCLHPFAGWTSPGESPFAFVVQPWQKYISWPDVYLNVAGFLPFGFMLVASLREGRRKAGLVFVALLASALLSFSIEFVQNWLPTRVSSNLDLAANTLGGLLGALAGARWGRAFVQGEALQRWRERRIQPGHIGELGLLLIGLWWLTQLEPMSMLFGAGDFGAFFELPPPLAFSAPLYLGLEAAVVASGTLGMGLLLRRCMRQPSWLFVAFVFAVGLALRSFANALFLSPEEMLDWATPGALRGLAAGLLLVVAAARLPRWMQHSLANLALLVCTALVNFAPENPYVAMAVQISDEGHLPNFYGLTRLVTLVWPFLALAWLSAQAALQRR